MPKLRALRRFIDQIKRTGEEIEKTFRHITRFFKAVILGAQSKAWQLRILLPLALFLIAGVAFFPALHLPGHIVHSDMDFGFQSDYMFRIFPLSNDLWSTTNFFNMPRIAVLFPLSILGKIFQLSPSLWQKIVIFSFLYIASISMYALIIKLFKEDRLLGRLKCPPLFLYFAAFIAGLFYAYNPYPVIRIQHLYLLVGYGLMPLVFLFAVHLTENFTRISHQVRTYQQKSHWWGSLEKLYKMRPESLKKTTSPDRIICSIIGFAILWAACVGAVHYLFFNFFVIAAWGLYRIIRYALQDRWAECFQVSLRLIIGGGLTVFLLLYYLLPYIDATTIGSINPPNINSIDSVDMVSRNNLPHLAIYLISYWWGLIDFHTLPLTFWIGGGFLIATMFTAMVLRIHNKFVLFMTGFSVVTYFLSLGTKWIPDLFVWLVFRSPLSGPIGFIFRDSNKFIGLLAFALSILLAYGLVSLFEILSRLSQEHQKENQQRKKKRLNYFTGLMVGLVIVITGSLHYYFQPIHQLYFGQLYYPTPIPRSYSKTADFLERNKEDPFTRTLMMPRYEMLVTPGEGYCVATWNARQNQEDKLPPRATSAMDIWSLNQRTFHPQEGSTVFWHTMYDYLFDMLGEGKSNNIGKLVARLGVDRLIFHQDVLGFEEALKGISKNISQQERITPLNDDSLGFFDVFSVKSLDWAHLYARNLLSFSGLSMLDNLLHYPAFQDNQTAFSFAAQNSQSANLNTLNPGDLIQTHQRKEVVLSQIDPQYFLHPFDATLYGNPFYRWSKLRTDTPDWAWQLQALNIPSEKREFDFGKGIAYSFVPRMIDLDPYEDFQAHGTPYNFSAYLEKDENLLQSDVPNVLTIQEGFSNAYDNLPSAFGKSIVGDGEYWRVAKTKKLPAKPNNGYFFEIVLSGRDTHKVHAKVKFYDAANEEVGVAYVSAPKEVETFDLIKFKGLYVTPPETESLQVEILSLQNPEVRSFWYLHDFTILDLEKKIAPNVLSFPYRAPKSDLYTVFVRAFESHKGGRVAFRWKSVDQENEQIFATKNEFQNQFKWYSLGSMSLNKGEKYELDFENLEGVNALNLVAVVPNSYLQQVEDRFEEQMQDFHQLVLLESDIDFQVLGHKQIQDHNAHLSNGKSISLGNGFIRSDFEILQKDTYQLQIRTKMFAQEDKRSEKGLKILIKEKGSGKTLHYETVDIFGPFQRIKWIETGKVELDKGPYEIQVEFRDNTPSLVTLDDFRRWKQDDFFYTLDEKEVSMENCSPYVKHKVRDLQVFLEDDQLRGEIKASASCDWVSLVSPPLNVKEKEHYFLSFENAVKNNNKFHFKILYLNKQRTLLDTQVFSFPQQEEFPSYLIEEIVTIPPQARFMQLQFLTRLNPAEDLQFTIKDFLLKNFEDFPMLDLLALSPDLPAPKAVAEVQHVEKVLGGYDIELPKSPSGESERYTLQVGESFTPLWKIQDGSQEILPHTSNMVLNAYPVTLEEEVKTVKYRLRINRTFYLGLFLSIMTLLAMLVVFWHYFLQRFKTHEGDTKD